MSTTNLATMKRHVLWNSYKKMFSEEERRFQWPRCSVEDLALHIVEEFEGVTYEPILKKVKPDYSQFAEKVRSSDTRDIVELSRIELYREYKEYTSVVWPCFTKAEILNDIVKALHKEPVKAPDNSLEIIKETLMGFANNKILLEIPVNELTNAIHRELKKTVGMETYNKCWSKQGFDGLILECERKLFAVREKIRSEKIKKNMEKLFKSNDRNRRCFGKKGVLSCSDARELYFNLTDSEHEDFMFSVMEYTGNINLILRTKGNMKEISLDNINGELDISYVGVAGEVINPIQTRMRGNMIDILATLGKYPRLVGVCKMLAEYEIGDDIDGLAADMDGDKFKVSSVAKCRLRVLKSAQEDIKKIMRFSDRFYKKIFNGR